MNAHSSQKVERTHCPSAEEWVGRMGSVHTTKHDSGIRRNEVLTLDTMQGIWDILG